MCLWHFRFYPYSLFLAVPAGSVAGLRSQPAAVELSANNWHYRCGPLYGLLFPWRIWTGTRHLYNKGIQTNAFLIDKYTSTQNINKCVFFCAPRRVRCLVVPYVSLRKRKSAASSARRDSPHCWKCWISLGSWCRHSSNMSISPGSYIMVCKVN